MHKTYNSGQEIDKHLISVNRTENRIKSNLSIKIGRIGSILSSGIRSLKRNHITNRKVHTKAMVEKENHSHEYDPNVSHGKIRAYTFFLVR